MVDKIENLISIRERVPIKFPIENHSFNMSMLTVGKETHVAFRNSDIEPYTSAAGKTSYVYLGKIINDELKDLKTIRFHGYSIRLWDRYNGMEDPRLFFWQGNIWCLFTRPNHSITKIFMVMLNLDSGEYYILDDPQGRPFTKNWMPYVNGTRLYFVVDTSPFSLYEFDNGLKLIKNNKGLGYLISGGSNIHEFEDKLVAIVHGKTEDESARRRYWHAVVTWNKDFENMKIGKKFIFEKEGIEFCLSMTIDDEQITIPYSMNDDGVSILRVDRKNFGSLI